MATVFWDAHGTVLTDYLDHGSTITGTYYTDLIRKVRAALKEKRRGKLHCGVDHAPAYTSPCANLHLAPERKPRQHPTTQFVQAEYHF